jgi:hypothetical protein
MLEVMGLKPWLMVDNNENHKDATVHEKFRMMDFKMYAANPFPVASYVEMGMSCDPGIRRFFRSMGAKVSKLYLGNILNIDIETMTFMKGVNFSHHVAGELDEIWVSPHYDFHAEYAGSINALCGKTRIAPYVWDPMFIENMGQMYDDKGLSLESDRTFVIMEPNISFQKCALIPIMILERNYRMNKRPIEVLVGNGERLMKNPFFIDTIFQNLELVKDNRITFSGRHDIPSIMRDYPYATAICHQFNNQYNYMIMEYLHAGFPVIHNAPDWSDIGYYYKGHSVSDGSAALARSRVQHETNSERYKAFAEALKWRHSIYNPEVQQAWQALLV